MAIHTAVTLNRVHKTGDDIPKRPPEISGYRQPSCQEIRKYLACFPLILMSEEAMFLFTLMLGWSKYT